MRSDKRSTRRGGLTSLRDAMEGYLRDSGLASKLALQRVYSAWDAACGARLAAHARPVRFRDGQLLVEVQSSAHMHELENFAGEGLRRAANQRLGRAEILRVAFQLKR